MNNYKIAVMLFGVALGGPAMAVDARAASAVMYKNPGCECCDGHAAALERAGFKIRIVPSEDLAAIKAKAGIPAELRGCHTLMVGGYIVEGHVPVAVVERLLAEKPRVRGIALPGMPAGAPGMNGSKTSPFRVLSFGADGTRLYAVE